MKNLTRQKLRSMFLDWFNNFLSVECFAQYYGLSFSNAERVIKLGRILHEKSVTK